MRGLIPASVRRLQVLRQVAYSPEGLRIGDVRGFKNQPAGAYLRDLARDGLVDRVPLKPGATTSNRPLCRYVITEAGRAVLVRETT